jgi:hypothetical protein
MRGFGYTREKTFTYEAQSGVDISTLVGIGVVSETFSRSALVNGGVENLSIRRLSFGYLELLVLAARMH